jgi:2Fe-2S ferredoxin
MPKITYIEHDGAQYTVEAELGSTVMETLRNPLPRIVAECGGGCTCATVHVDEKWFEVVGPPSAEEEEMFDTACSEADLSTLLPDQGHRSARRAIGTNLSRPVSVTLRRVVVSSLLCPRANIRHCVLAPAGRLGHLIDCW